MDLGNQKVRVSDEIRGYDEDSWVELRFFLTLSSDIESSDGY